MRKKIHEIPGKLLMEWDSDVNAIIDTWDNQFVTLEQFEEAICKKGIDCAKEHGTNAWIVDAQEATSVFTRELMEYIDSTVLPLFHQSGIKYFLSIRPKDIVANITVKKYTEKAGPHGITLVECDSVESALEWLKGSN